jgi:hypothetical protein
MKPFVLYCKSYKTDLKRVIRLAQSIRLFNTEKLPFYVSVTKNELPLFREHLGGLGVELLTDEEIIKASPRLDAEQIRNMPGSHSQQVVKSEFWRLGQSQAYLCLDSDALFIRPFGAADFMAPDGTPYTVIDESHESLEEALRNNRGRAITNYIVEADTMQQLFCRTSRRYSFGPFPLAWHRDVWESLDTQYLQPRNMSFADAIAKVPIESRWYGEALLAYKAIPLLPCQPFFKVYHYAWQFDQDRRKNIKPEQLAQLYSGFIYQSAWEREMDWPREGGSLLSRTARRIRRKLRRM